MQPFKQCCGSGSAPLTNGSGFGSGSCRMATKYFCTKVFLFVTFLSCIYRTSLNIKSHKGVTKHQQSRFFLLFLLDDRRIRTSYQWIRIQEAQKQSDPTDPNPQHCFKEVSETVFYFCLILTYSAPATPL